MMNNLIDIQTQIEKLQKQANDIKAKEFDKTVREIIAKMHAFGITAKDLQAAGSSRTKTKTKAPARIARGKAKGASAGSVAAKYRGPNGENWSGRGLPPRWLAALLAEGKKKEDFAIKS
jgi:DNA-binding protein H-NS